MFWFTHEMYDDLAGSPAWNPYGSDERWMFFLLSCKIRRGRRPGGPHYPQVYDALRVPRRGAPTVPMNAGCFSCVPAQFRLFIFPLAFPLKPAIIMTVRSF